MYLILETGGIPHLEDLAIEEFLNAVKFGNQMIVTEKLDGVNLAFGFDERGEFFTSRELKGGKRFYNVNDYESKIWMTGFKAAHLALEKASDKIKMSGAMKAGDVVNCEILFGALPNTVPYNGDVNQIIFLNALKGSPNIDLLHKILDNKKVSVTLKNVPFTEDGKSIKYGSKSYTWRFVKVPSVDPKLLSKAFSQKQLAFKIQELEKILNSPSGILAFSNLEIMSIPLNKKPQNVDVSKWKAVVGEIKQKRSQLENEIQNLKLDIKEELLNNLVRNVASKFGPELEKGGWIEGLVFRDPKTKKIFKLVDKNLFTFFNQFNWKIRELLSASGGKQLQSLLGKMYLKMAQSIGHEQLAKPFAKRYIRSFGKTTEEILKNLSTDIDINETKTKWIEILEKSQKIAERIFNWYEKNKTKLKKQVSMGGRIYSVSYSDAIDDKTKQTFASLFEEIKYLKNQIQKADSPEKLVALLIKPDYLIIE